MTTTMKIAILRILTTAKSWSAGLGLKRRGDVCVPRPPQTGHERPERAGEPDEVGGGIVLYLKITYMYYCDLFDCLQTLQTIIDLSIKIADRLESDNLLKGNESEPSPRNQKHVKRTCAGHQVRILSLLEKKWFFSKNYLFHLLHRSMSRDVRASVAREFESATRDIPGVTLRPAEEANTAQWVWILRLWNGFSLNLSLFRSFNVIAEEE